MKRLSTVLICMFALAALAAWAPNIGAFPDFGGTAQNCKECHTIFSGPSADHGTHAAAVGNVCSVCHGSPSNFPPLLSDCVKCHLGPGLRAHHENAPFPGTNGCGTQTTGCHVGDPAPSPENTVPPGYAMPPATIALDPCDGSEERIGPNVVPSSFPSTGSFTTSLDNDGDQLYDSADPDCAPAASADVAVTKDASPDPVVVGSDLTYTLTVTNNGPDDVNVTLTDTLPAGVTFVSATPDQGSCNESAGVVSCDLGLVTNGSTVTVTIIVTPTAGGSLVNDVTITGSGNDPDPSNNSDQTTTTATAPDIALSPASASFGTVAPGSTAATDITIANNGTADLTVSSLSVDDQVNFILDLESSTCQGTGPATINVDLDGAQAGTTSTGTGSGTVTFDLGTSTLSWDVSFSGLTGPVTVTHFHGPAIPGQTAGVEVDIGAISGLISPLQGNTTLTPTQAADFFSGLWYINIHTALNPGGEIRGQVSGNVSGTLVVAPSTSCTTSVVFTPQTTDQTDATLTVDSDDPDTPSATVSLTGNAPAAAPGGGGGGCALITSSAGAAGAAGTFGLLLIAAGWFIVRRRKKE